MLKARSPWVSQVVMHGDRRKYCVALVSIDEQAVGSWARQHDLVWSDYATLADQPAVRDLVWNDVEQVNAQLPSYETVKSIHLVDHDLSIEQSELTPSHKVCRSVVEQHYAGALDRLYQEARPAS